MTTNSEMERDVRNNLSSVQLTDIHYLIENYLDEECNYDSENECYTLDNLHHMLIGYLIYAVEKQFPGLALYDALVITSNIAKAYTKYIDRKE